MAKQRFRDVKKGKVSPSRPKKDGASSETCSHAGVRRRLKAVITDSFMLLMPIMYIVFYLVFDGREGFAQNMMLGWIYILLPLVIIQIIFMSRSKLGQTPGMKAYDLVLIDLKTGEKPHTGVIIYRQMLSLLSFFVFGWITMFFRKDSRTLHELLSDTTICYIPEGEQKAK